MITGYIPGTTLAAGTVQKLSCISSGGNPLATLTWFKNDKKVSSNKDHKSVQCYKKWQAEVWIRYVWQFEHASEERA